MMPPHPAGPSWEALSAESRLAVSEVVQLLAASFTGRVELEVTDGTVTAIRKTEVHRFGRQPPPRDS